MINNETEMIGAVCLAKPKLKTIKNYLYKWLLKDPYFTCALGRALWEFVKPTDKKGK